MSSAPPARFEHIALAVHIDDLFGWDRLLRRDLGGCASMGGAVPKIGFQGGQIDYPGDGMLEILSWIEGTEEKSAMKRYVDKHGGRAALHHLTFLVDDFAASVERARELGYEPMLGRNTSHWKEFYVREASLRPAGFLVQVLQANKDAIQSLPGWGNDWAPFTVAHPTVGPAAEIAGVRMASTDLEASARLFVELLGAESTAKGSELRLRWPGSSMGVRLVKTEVGDEGHVELRVPAGRHDDIHRALAEGPASSVSLLSLQP